VMEALPLWVPDLLASVDKTSLHPLRLASILALAYLIGTHVGRDGAVVRGAWVRPFAAMGQQSLPVFCFGILLSFLARLMLEEGDGWAMQVAVNLFCFLALYAVARLAAWSRAMERTPTSPGLPPAAPQR